MEWFEATEKTNPESPVSLVISVGAVAVITGSVLSVTIAQILCC